MIYNVATEYYEEWDNKVVCSHMFVCADSIVEATQKVSTYYGEDCLESIVVKPFAPDDFIIFKPEDADLFYAVQSTIGKNVVW